MREVQMTLRLARKITKTCSEGIGLGFLGSGF